MLAKDNETLTHVGPGTPMGNYLRSQWAPILRSQRVEAGGAPVRVRLFGENYVVFRATDGSVGFIDEACPHRGASMALARNEGCALRCLYHGWLVDISGDVVDAASEIRGKEIAANIKLRKYGVNETGSMIWVYVGKDAEPPAFPAFEWTDADVVEADGAIVHCNWLQALEGAIDPVHVGYLHNNWLPGMAISMLNSGTKYEIVDQPYGFSGAAIRSLPGGQIHYARVKEFALPYYSHIPFEPLDLRTVIFAIPMDDEKCYLWYLKYTVKDPKPKHITTSLAAGGLVGQPKDVPDWQYGIDSRLDHYPNPDNFRDSMPYDPENLWGQDRAAMMRGETHTGLPGLTTEDVAITESMGFIVDRTKEHLGPGDVLIVKARRLLLAATEGKFPSAEPVNFRDIRSRAGFLQPGQNWRDLPRYSWEMKGNEELARPSFSEQTS